MTIQLNAAARLVQANAVARIEASHSMSDELSVGLAKAGVSKDVLDALRQAMMNSHVDHSADAYASAMTRSFDDYGIEGVKSQVMYMVNNMKRWQGDEAKRCKKILNKWSISK